MNDGQIWWLDARTLAVIGSAGVGKRPVAVAISSDGEHLYVACLGSGSIAIVNSQSLATVKTVPLRDGPVKLASGPGDVIYAMCPGGIVAVIDTTAGRVVESARLGEHEGSVAVGRNGDHRWYVTDPWGGTLKAVTARNTAVSETLTFGNKTPIDVAPGPGGLLCIACQTGVLDLVRLREEAAAASGITDSPRYPEDLLPHRSSCTSYQGAQAKKCHFPRFALPAPLGPRNPNTWPRRIVRSIPSSARVSP